MTTSAELMGQWKKDYGPNIAIIGRKAWVDMPRLPTGVFPIDLAMGGGFPMGKCSIIFGPEASLKTTLLMCAIREGQKMYPDKKAVLIDVEHDLNVPYVESLGVDPDRLIVMYPEYAEMAVDFVESLIYAQDVFCVGLDSIAALTKQGEIEASADKQSYGGASILVGKMYRKAVVAFAKMQNGGVQAPAFIATNQIRYKMDAGPYGNPETMPGGQAQKYAASMILRVYAKKIMDKKLHPALPVYTEGSVVIKKWKCPILAMNAEYKMQMIQAGEHGPGYIEDWNTVSTYMQELDYLSKGEKGGWVMSGENYKLLKDCKDALYADPIFLQNMKASIIAEMLDKSIQDTEKPALEGDESADIITEEV